MILRQFLNGAKTYPVTSTSLQVCFDLLNAMHLRFTMILQSFAKVDRDFDWYVLQLGMQYVY